MNQAIRVRYPEYRETVLIIDGVVYENVCGDAGAVVLARFLRTKGSERKMKGWKRDL